MTFTSLIARYDLSILLVCPPYYAIAPISLMRGLG